jgi:glycosyltransferase involved in cell wall biosynthesis
MHIAFISMRYPRNEKEWIRIYERTLVRYLKKIVDITIFSWALFYKEHPYKIDNTRVKLIPIMNYEKIQKLYDNNFGPGAALLDMINDFLKIIGTTRAVHRLHKQKRVDLILAASYSMSAFYPLFISKLKRIPLATQAFGYDVDVVSEIGYGLRLKRSKQRIMSNIALKYSDGLLPNSRGLAEDTVLASYPDKVWPIHHGVDFDKYKAAGKKKGGKRLKVLNVGGLIKVKGWNYIVETANLLKKYDIEFIITGRASDLSEYNARVKELGLKNVRFYESPSHEELMEHFSNSDIFFLPSLSEGLPNSMLEAASMELALIGSGKGGTRDIIRDGKNGYYVKSSEPEEFAEKILYLYNNPEKLRQMKKESREIVMKNFNWVNIVKDMKKVFQRIINSKTNPKNTIKRDM